VPGCYWQNEYTPNPPLTTDIMPSELSTYAGQVYAATGPSLMTSSGNGTWKSVPPPSDTTYQYSGVSYGSDGVGFAVGQIPVEPTPYHGFYDTTVNGLWQPTSPSSTPLVSIFAFDHADVFYVGSSVFGLVNGGGANLLPGNTTTFFEHVWGSSPSDVYAVGDNGVIAHGSAAGFSTEVSGTTQILMSVWGLGPNDVYAVGASATFLHSTGNGTWTALSAPIATTDAIYDVWGLDDGDLYLATTDGMWRSLPDGTWHKVGPSAQTVWGTASCNIYAITSDGWIYHSTP
jgi:hypothetical protein